jgi:hypothetical protein
LIEKYQEGEISGEELAEGIGEEAGGVIADIALTKAGGKVGGVVKRSAGKAVARVAGEAKEWIGRGLKALKREAGELGSKAGRYLREEAAPRLNPANYEVSGLGTSGGNIRYKGPNRGGSAAGAREGAIASASEGAPGSLLSESSLSRRQAAIHSALPESGATGFFAKRGVSMSDLRAIGRVTGDEYSMFTLGSRRFVIRGYGNQIKAATPELVAALKEGRYGRWSGHTHPPGYLTKASTVDREFLPTGQGRSAVWGDEGYKVFHRTPSEDVVFEVEQRRRLMRRFYGEQ